jgi:hypothetical protein
MPFFVRRRLVPLVAVLAIFALPLVAPSTASAAAVPKVPAYTAAIDAYSKWQTEKGCDSTAKPGNQRIADLLRSTYGTGITIYLSRACSASSESGHDDNRALDWMTNVRNDAQRDIAETFLAWLQASDAFGNPHAMARRMGVMYVIWNNKMWRAYAPERGWTEYGGCLDESRASASYDNTCHRNHVHLSLGVDAAAGKTSFYTDTGTGTDPGTDPGTGAVPAAPAGAVPACPAPAKPGTPPALATTGGDLKLVPAARILATAQGVGTPAGACRLGAGKWLDVPVLGVGGVPKTGVSAVALNLTAYGSTGATTLSAWPAGRARPAHAAMGTAARKVGTGMVLVPPGAGGKVSVYNAAGTTDVFVDVLGYVTTSANASRLHPVAAKSLLDTTTSKPLAAGASRTLDIGAAAGVPASGTTGAVLTVGVVEPSVLGGLTLEAVGGTQSALWDVEFDAKDSKTRTVLVGTSSDGRLVVTNRSKAAVHVRVAVSGWLGASSVAGGKEYFPREATVALDTKGKLGAKTAVAGGATYSFAVTGGAKAPTGVAMVALHTLAVNATKDTGFTLWTYGATRPAIVSSTPQATLADGGLQLVAPSYTKVSLYSAAGTTDATADVVGYWR